jgi:E3 ubiquitin-protein ligase RNF14
MLIPDPTYTICPRPACQRPVPPPTATSSEIKINSVPSKRVIRLSDVANPSPSPNVEVPLPEPIITSEPTAHDERWDRYRRCTYCGYSFCLYCSNTWHGPHSPCAFTAGSSLVQEYLSYAEGSFERQKMELRRGKRNLEKMVAQWQEDEENKKWMEEKTMPCAGCGVRVERRCVNQFTVRRVKLTNQLRV